MILALNTAQPIHELALLTHNLSDGSCKLLKEIRWSEDRKDVETLVPHLQTLLEELGATQSEISKLVVVKGPGSFTSLRTGLAFMNALKEGLSPGNSKPVTMYELSTFECLERKAATLSPLLVILPAGGLDAGIYFKRELKVGPLAELLARFPKGASHQVLAELSETLRDELYSIALEKQWHILEAHELQTLGQSIQTLGLSGLNPVESAEAFYLKDPKITVSQDPWKQANR